VACRGAAGRKGGRLARGTGGADLADQQAEGTGRVAEAQGGVFLGQAVNEDGAQGFVLALLWAGGLKEEALHEGIVHGRRGVRSFRWQLQRQD
jgi:hypothetical protein